jgi:hypothetical protein
LSIVKQYDVYKIVIQKVDKTKIFVLYVGIIAVINRSTSIIVMEGCSGHVYIYPNT